MTESVACGRWRGTRAVHALAERGRLVVRLWLCLRLATLVFVSLTTGNVHAETGEENKSLRIATWHLDGINLPFPGSSVGRATNEKPLLGRYQAIAAKLDADVFAIQGAPNYRSLRRLFPARTHHIVFSRQALGAKSTRPRNAREGARPRGFTAIVVKRSLKIRTMRQQHLSGLANRRTRAGEASAAGTALEFRAHGRQFWVLSVDLPGGCNTSASTLASDEQDDDQSDDASQDCSGLADQAHELSDWIERREELRLPYVIAGRLNRFVPAAETSLSPAQNPLWAMLRTEPSEPPKPVIGPPAMIAPAPPEQRDPLLQPAKTQLREVALTPFVPPSRAPNERIRYPTRKDLTNRLKSAKQSSPDATANTDTNAATEPEPARDPLTMLFTSIRSLFTTASSDVAENEPGNGAGAEPASQPGVKPDKSLVRDVTQKELLPDASVGGNASNASGRNEPVDANASTEIASAELSDPTPSRVLAFPPHGTTDSCPTLAISDDASQGGRTNLPTDYILVGRTVIPAARIENSALLRYDVPPEWKPLPAGAKASLAEDDDNHWAHSLPSRCPMVVDLRMTEPTESDSPDSN